MGYTQVQAPPDYAAPRLEWVAWRFDGKHSFRPWSTLVVDSGWPAILQVWFRHLRLFTSRGSFPITSSRLCICRPQLWLHVQEAILHFYDKHHIIVLLKTSALFWRQSGRDVSVSIAASGLTCHSNTDWRQHFRNPSETHQKPIRNQWPRPINSLGFHQEAFGWPLLPRLWNLERQPRIRLGDHLWSRNWSVILSITQSHRLTILASIAIHHL